MKVLRYKKFLFESNKSEDFLKLGSYSRISEEVINISPLRFNEDTDLDNALPGIEININNEDCLLSYKAGDEDRSISLPKSTIKFPGEQSDSENISIITDSRWMANDKNSDLLYEFLEDYLSEYCEAEIKARTPKNELVESEVSTLMEELGCKSASNKVFDVIEDKKITFSDEDNRFYKFKRKDKGPISSVEIYEAKGTNHPYVRLKFGKIHECNISSGINSYTINSNTISELLENPIFSRFIDKGKPNDKDGEYQDNLIDLLKKEIKNKKNYQEEVTESNISFLVEELEFFMERKEIDKIIRLNSI